MYCSHEYLSIDPKKKLATATLTPTNFKKVNYYKLIMSADISKTIKDRKFGF